MLLPMAAGYDTDLRGKTVSSGGVGPMSGGGMMGSPEGIRRRARLRYRSQPSITHRVSELLELDIDGLRSRARGGRAEPARSGQPRAEREGNSSAPPRARRVSVHVSMLAAAQTGSQDRPARRTPEPTAAFAGRSRAFLYSEPITPTRRVNSNATRIRARTPLPHRQCDLHAAR